MLSSLVSSFHTYDRLETDSRDVLDLSRQRSYVTPKTALSVGGLLNVDRRNRSVLSSTVRC